jgi:DNA-binding GntR family transcriptional regulator
MMRMRVICVSGHQLLGTVSAVEAVAARLRDKILDGLIQSPSEVTEASVVEAYGVSRPTARSAITVLVNDGVLRQGANKPAYVPRLSGADLRDLFFVRIPLELQVVQRVTELGTVPLAARAAVDDIGRLGENSPASHFVEADLRFHSSLVESVRSLRMSRQYRAIQGEMHLSMVQSKQVLGAERVSREHRGILDALLRCDGPRAATLMRTHLEDACREIAASLDGAE